MTSGLRKFVLTTHITLSVGWIGAVAAFLVLSIAGLTSQHAEVVCGAYLSMNLICSYLIVPLSLAALATGLIQSLGTRWGLFRHYWVVVKFLLTILSVTVLLMHQFTAVAEAAKLGSAAAAGTWPKSELDLVGFELLRASGLGLVVLLAIATLSVYKPWGLTPYGRRKQQERRLSPPGSLPSVGDEARSDSGKQTTSDGFPRGLGIFLVAGIGALLLVVLASSYLTGHGLHHGH
jgi:uncharacterized membrane protein